MRPHEMTRHRIRLTAGVAMGLGVGAILLPPARSFAQPRAALEPALNVAAPPCADDGPIPTALCTALQAYSRGEITTARSWTALAAKLLATAPAPEAGAVPFPASNASQLLEMLQLYGTYVYGTQPGLDAQYTALVPRLQQIESLNRDATRPDHVGAEPVEYHPLTHLVTRIGDVRIDYHLLTRQVDRLGDVRLDYNTLTRMPEKIGGIEFDYDLVDGRVSKIAGVDVR
jgi:hypothetical protein